MSNDNIAIIAFVEGWELDGTGPDGLPLFREVVTIRKSVPPLTEVSYVATPEDFEEYPEPYKLFQKQREGRAPGVAGYPLALWPAISPAEFKNCAARGIHTVEQLAPLANRRSGGTEVPASIIELAKRAKKLIELQGSVGKFEAVINQLTAERDQLAEELKQAASTISAQNALINQMRPQPAVAA